jgi:hypothetical protein
MYFILYPRLLLVSVHSSDLRIRASAGTTPPPVVNCCSTQRNYSSSEGFIGPSTFLITGKIKDIGNSPRWVTFFISFVDSFRKYCNESMFNRIGFRGSIWIDFETKTHMIKDKSTLDSILDDKVKMYDMICSNLCSLIWIPFLYI